MRLILIIVALLAVCMPAVAVDMLPDDAAISKTVTLDFKGEALSDMVKALSKATGVRIRTSEDVADQKVTILVDQMPVRDVLNRLATLFGWNWTVKKDDEDRDTYVIYDPLKKKRDADRQAALDKAWKALGAKLDNENADSFFRMLALLQYRSLSPDLRKAYLSGMRICYNTDSAEVTWHPSQTVMDYFVNARSRLQKPAFATWDTDFAKPSNVTIHLRSAVGADKITAQGEVDISYYSPDYNESNKHGFTMTEGDFPLYVQEIDHPSESLDNTLPNKPADGLLNKKVSVSTAELEAEGAVVDEKTGECFATRTDLLSAVHKKLGLQIISDYYSSWGQSKGVRGGTLKQLMEAKALPGLPANWGWDGNILFVRVKDVRTADSREIPNRYLRSWQAVVKKQGCRGLEELAQAAALLSDDQREAISDDHRLLKLGECKEINDVGGWESPVLRFYGVLTPKQKKDIFATHVGVMELTQEQRGALASVLRTMSSDRAGLYNNDGLDANEPKDVRGPLGARAVRLWMTCSGSFTYLKPGDDIESRVLRKYTATTPEEALLDARNLLGDDADPQNVVAQDDIVYTLAVINEGYTLDEPAPQFCGSIGASTHSTYHRVKIKIPKKQ